MTDYSQYQSWPAVEMPDGSTKYKVPNSGYLYDPFLSEMKKRPVLFVNNQAEYDAKQKEIKKQQDIQEKASDPLYQLAPVAGTVGGLYVANKLLNPSTPSTPTNPTPPPGATPPPAQSPGFSVPTGATPPTSATGQAALDSAMGPPKPSFENGGMAGPQPMPEGATAQPDGTVTDASGNNIGTWAEGVGGAILFYQGYKQFQDGDKIGGGLNMAAGAGYGLSAAGIGGATVAEAAPVLGGLAGLYNLGNLAANSGDLHKSDTGSATVQGTTSGASIGAGVGSIVPGVGTALGAGVGAILGGIYGLGAGLTASGKGERQQVRDKWRDNVIQNGIPLFDPKTYQGDQADGSTYDWGRDKFGFGKGEGDFDLSKPTIAKAAAYGNILAAMQGATGKGREAIATQFLGASTSNAADDLNVVKANFNHYLNKMGVKDLATAQKALDEAKPSMTDNEYQVFSSDLKELYAPAPAVNSKSTTQPAPTQTTAVQRPTPSTITASTDKMAQELAKRRDWANSR